MQSNLHRRNSSGGAGKGELTAPALGNLSELAVSQRSLKTQRSSAKRQSEKCTKSALLLLSTHGRECVAGIVGSLYRMRTLQWCSGKS